MQSRQSTTPEMLLPSSGPSSSERDWVMFKIVFGNRSWLYLAKKVDNSDTVFNSGRIFSKNKDLVSVWTLLCLCSIFNWIKICKLFYSVFIYVLHNIPNKFTLGFVFSVFACSGLGNLTQWLRVWGTVRFPVMGWWPVPVYSCAAPLTSWIGIIYS